MYSKQLGFFGHKGRPWCKQKWVDARFHPFSFLHIFLSYQTKSLFFSGSISILLPSSLGILRIFRSLRQLIRLKVYEVNFLNLIYSWFEVNASHNVHFNLRKNSLKNVEKFRKNDQLKETAISSQFVYTWN